MARRTVRRKKGGMFGCLGRTCRRGANAATRAVTGYDLVADTGESKSSPGNAEQQAALRTWKKESADAKAAKERAEREAAAAERAKSAEQERLHQERLAVAEREAKEAEQRARAAKAEADALVAERLREESEAKRAREAVEAEAERHEREAAKYEREEEAARAKLPKAEEKLSNSAPEDREGYKRVVREIMRAIMSAKGEKKKHQGAAEGIRAKLKVEGGRRRSTRRRKTRRRR